MRDRVVYASCRGVIRRRKLAEDLAIKAIWIDSLVDSERESELEMNF